MKGVVPILINLSSQEKQALVVAILAAAATAFGPVDFTDAATLKKAIAPLANENESALEEMRVANAGLIAEWCGVPASYFSVANLRPVLAAVQRAGALFTPHELRAAEVYLMCLVNQ